MASSPKFVCLFFLLITLSLSLQTDARDSQFFSKVTRNRDPATATTTTTTNNNNPNTYFNTNDEFVHLNKQEEQEEQPAFIPQTTETGYGLYGHENNYDKKYENFDNNNNNNYDENSFNFNNNNNNNYDENNFNFNKNNNNYENFNNYYKNTNNENHEKNYAPELKGLSGTSKYSTNNKKNNGESKYYGAGYNGGVEKQGMSDTRFLENGKYFYDVNAEKNFDANNNYMSYSNNYNNNYNNNGYYGNKENNYEEYYNKYQNQVSEEEFDFDQP